MLTIYTRTTCAYCHMVTKFLDLKGAKYEKVNLDEHPERADEAIKMSGVFSVPVTTNGKDVAIGWNPGKIMALL